MTAAELASFRTLLQAQAPPPPRPDGGLFARMRARLTVVEGVEPHDAAPRRRIEADDAAPRRRIEAGDDAPRRTSPAPPPPRSALSEWDELDARAVDPPPGTPPVFGRREAEPEPERAAVATTVALPTELAAVHLRPGPHLEETHATPDEPPPSPRIAAPAASPGTIAGWSRSRPANAQRRILLRLDAVLAAERQGLDARIAADAPGR